MHKAIAVAVIALCFAGFSCSALPGNTEGKPTGAGAGEELPSQTGDVRFHVETVAEGLEVPWAMVFTPDGRMFVTERPGRVRVIENGKLRPEPLAVIPDVVSRPGGECGLMGMAVHPDFATNHAVYLAYVYSTKDGLNLRVARYRETGTSLEDPKTIIEGIQTGTNHAGCRLAFGPDRKLYVTTGDATERELAQKLDSLAGKTLRLNDDGSVPEDNPFVGRAGARPEIWSYGHRNAQGLAWQPGTGLMFQTEHGPSGFDAPGGGDEVNIVERGKNYGWPRIHHTESAEGLVSPLAEYTPSVAPANGTFCSGKLFPRLAGNFLFTGLRGRCVVRLVLDGRTLARQERLFKDVYGRLRDIVEGPDGALYLATSNRDNRGNPAANDDRILKLTPATR